MSQHHCGDGGGELMNWSRDYFLPGEMLRVECDKRPEMMPDRNKDGSGWRVAWQEEGLQISCKGSIGRHWIEALSLLFRYGGLSEWFFALLSVSLCIWRLDFSFLRCAHIPALLLEPFPLVPWHWLCRIFFFLSLSSIGPIRRTEHTHSACRRIAWEWLFGAAEAQSALQWNAPNVILSWPGSTCLYKSPPPVALPFFTFVSCHSVLFNGFSLFAIYLSWSPGWGLVLSRL